MYLDGGENARLGVHLSFAGSRVLNLKTVQHLQLCHSWETFYILGVLQPNKEYKISIFNTIPTMN